MRTNPPKILLMEDDPITAAYLQSNLEALGCRVTTSASGEEALELAEAQPPDLILADIELAGVMDGLEAARRIRQTRADTPVVIVSGHDEPGLRLRAAELLPGYCAYLNKPVSVHRIRAAILGALPQLAG